MPRAVLAILVLLLTGCASPATSPAVPAQPTGTHAGEGAQGGAPASLSYACPWPGATTRADGLCVGTLGSPGESLAEPDLAVSPLDPKIVALGVNVFGAGAASARAAQGIAVFVSRDGAASWIRAALPAPPFPDATRARIAADPSLVFDDAGALHLVALAGGLDAGYVVWHAMSADAGATWSAPQLLADDLDNDREWIVRGPHGELVVTWQDSGSSLATSLDGGKSWRTTRLAEGCIGTARVAFHRGEALSACVRLDDGGPSGLDVLRVDLAQGNATRIAHVAARMVWPDLHDMGDTLVMTLEDYANASVAYVASTDGGLTWSAPTSLGARTTLDDGWTRAYAQAAAVAPGGALHIILGGAPPEPAGLDAVTGPPTRGAKAFAHLMLDAGGSVVLERALTDGAPRVGVAPPFNSDYAGIAFAGNDTLLAWPQGGGIDFTRVSSATR